MVRTFLKVYMELGSSFLFLQEQIKDIIIITALSFPRIGPGKQRRHQLCLQHTSKASVSHYGLQQQPV